MKLVSFVLATSAAAAVAATTTAAKTREWSYRPSSAKFLSPAEWAAEYPNCAGQRQSPVDIPAGSSSGRSAPLMFAGECADFSVQRTADAYRADVQNGSCTVTANAVAYPFAQLHVHAPSEHRIRGRALDGELHFVHKNAAGNVAVVGLFLEQKLLGATDPFVASVLAGLQRVNGTSPVALKLPSYAALATARIQRGRVFNYPGSLTTPGCDEVVDWWVVESPLAISALDLVRLHASLGKIGITDLGRNARPTQPLNGRTFATY